MIEFQLDTASGVATYLQLVQQVRQALQLGLLERGDQLPTAQQVVARLAINPNTVLKAYRDLEREGLVRPRPGQGTFVVGTLPRTDPHAQLARHLAASPAATAGLGALLRERIAACPCPRALTTCPVLAPAALRAALWDAALSTAPAPPARPRPVTPPQVAQVTGRALTPVPHRPARSPSAHP